MAQKQPRVRTLNVNYRKGAGGTRISKEMYDAVKKAILAAVPRNREGVLFRELPAEVKRRAPQALFQHASVSWYTTTDKLDLEARRLIERVPGSNPQRLRRR